MKNSTDTQVTNSETQESNKLIAEFTGYEIQKDPTERFFGRYLTPDTKVWVKKNELSFDTDWNYLMPVVEKILNLKDTYAQERQRVFNSISPDINITYTAVISFIKWYNENK